VFRPGADVMAGLGVGVPRKLRENQPGGIYHVFARGNNRELIYRDDVDRHLYLRRLERVAGRLEWRGLAYCLMGNHLHLLIETPAADLSAGMQALHGAYAQGFNSRHRRVGHVFQGRYGAVLMRSDAQVCATAAYIARNPIKAGLCEAPGEWPWDSLQSVLTGQAPSWIDGKKLLAFFAPDPDIARRFYRVMSTTPPAGET
jgi:REP element-mobilizing transposase RayT